MKARGIACLATAIYFSMQSFFIESSFPFSFK